MFICSLIHFHLHKYQMINFEFKLLHKIEDFKLILAP